MKTTKTYVNVKHVEINGSVYVSLDTIFDLLKALTEFKGDD
jgi:hypothetical protein